MDIFSRSSLKRPPPRPNSDMSSENGYTQSEIFGSLSYQGGRTESAVVDIGVQKVRHEAYPVLIYSIYTIIGGCIGFTIRFILSMAGYDKWLFTYFPSFVSFGKILDSIKFDVLLVVMLAFFCTLGSLYLVVHHFLITRR